MKRNLEQETFNLKRSKTEFNHFYLHNSYHDLGSKLGLIVGTKLLDTIKKNGPLFINYYFNIYHNMHIEIYIKDFISNCNIIDYINLLKDKDAFEKYFDFFNNGFKSSFINILQSNLTKFPDILNKLNEHM